MSTEEINTAAKDLETQEAEENIIGNDDLEPKQS